MEPLVDLPMDRCDTTVRATAGGTATYRCACRPVGYVCVTGIPLRFAVNVPHCNLGHPIVSRKVAESLAQ